MNRYGPFSARFFAGWGTALGLELPYYPKHDPSVSSSQKEVEAFAVLIGLDAAEKDITFNEALDRRGVP